jgi:hypothetical protein
MKVTSFIIFCLALGLIFSCTSDDLTGPEITLEGDNPVFIQVGEEYVDQGAEATDNQDPNLGSVLLDLSQLDTDCIGTQEVRYFIQDEAGNGGAAIRTVHVQAPLDSFPGVYQVSIECGDDFILQELEVFSSAEDTLFTVPDFGIQKKRVLEFSVTGDNLNVLSSVDTGIALVDLIGDGALLNTKIDDWYFELNYDLIGSESTRTCSARFLKP